MRHGEGHMRLGKDFDTAIARELAAAGIEEYRVEHGGKHPKLVFMHQGQVRNYILSGSPSDHRALRNMVHDLRGLLGLTAARSAAAAAPPPPLPPPDPAWREAARARIAANPPRQPTDRDLRVASLLDDAFATPVDLARRAQAEEPLEWVRSHFERLERLVALGLAVVDDAGRYRRAGGGG